MGFHLHPEQHRSQQARGPSSLALTTGNPRVFWGDPDPDLEKPVPVVEGQVGYGFPSRVGQVLRVAVGHVGVSDPSWVDLIVDHETHRPVVGGDKGPRQICGDGQSSLVLPRGRMPQRQLTWAPSSRGIPRYWTHPGRVSTRASGCVHAISELAEDETRTTKTSSSSSSSLSSSLSSSPPW